MLPHKSLSGAAVAAGAALALAGLSLPAHAVSSGSPGDATIALDVNDSAAGGTYEETFKVVYSGETPDGSTPVYVYLPADYDVGQDPTGVRSMDPLTDWNTADEFTPCAEKSPADYVITQAQIDAIGNELADHIVAIDEAHFGEIGLADPSDPASDALVMVVYDLHDEGMYDCADDTYTAGYFAPDYIESAGMNVIAVDAYDWANRTGEDGDHLYEGVVAHELEHLLHNYSDPGELSWVDEGLADFAVFLNGYESGGSHVAYHQVFHRETSLTRWGGGLENYGASYTYVQYLWEQAGGNGDGTYDADGQYDAAGGDLLVKLVFENEADGIEGVNAAIAAFNAGTGASLRSAEDLFRDWALAVYLDDEASAVYDIKALDIGTEEASWGYTIDVANEVVWDRRGQYRGAVPEAKWDRLRNRPDPTALPFGTSYETFRNPGPGFALEFSGEPETVIAAHTGDTHWYGGYESQSDNVLALPTDGAVDSLDFWTWHFIEEGWDYGFVEAEVGGVWQTVPLVADDGTTVTTDDNPFGNNTEGNGLTGTSGGQYGVDEPQYVHLTAQLPAGTTDLRLRYSTDAAYLDTGWFVDDVVVDGAEVAPTSDTWSLIRGAQDNRWTVQLVATCDLTPGVLSAGETVDGSTHVYRFTGDSVSQSGFSTKCANQSKRDVTVVVSNLPTGDLTFLDADYSYRLVNVGAKPRR